MTKQHLGLRRTTTPNRRPHRDPQQEFNTSSSMYPSEAASDNRTNYRPARTHTRTPKTTTATTTRHFSRCLPPAPPPHTPHPAKTFPAPLDSQEKPSFSGSRMPSRHVYNSPSPAPGIRTRTLFLSAAPPSTSEGFSFPTSINDYETPSPFPSSTPSTSSFARAR